MFSSAEELLAYVKDEGVEIIDVRFCDLPGIMQHFTVPVSSFGPEVFEEGLMFDGSSVRGFQQIHESDMKLLPDPTSAFVDEFRGTKTLAINFFVHDPLTGSRTAATVATRSATRVATSRSRRPTTSATCATTSRWRWSAPACSSSAPTTRSVRRVRRRSTSASTSC